MYRLQRRASARTANSPGSFGVPNEMTVCLRLDVKFVRATSGRRCCQRFLPENALDIRHQAAKSAVHFRSLLACFRRFLHEISDFLASLLHTRAGLLGSISRISAIHPNSRNGSPDQLIRIIASRAEGRSIAAQTCLEHFFFYRETSQR